ncbi:thioredoxin [Microbacterium sp. Root61]|uniref:thioredoxin domain-containing protein n=1 Tax=Microbacterium sp. Root61 TaxID=1736570 RepID=UPI0006F2A220|nr:DUF255 domain-containing protein [Microbacterium sp. Root61]KRA23930.1 thioredoxin [Microbacterium sp. Root61]
MASRLADASSPYLRAHADNPVAWFPWGQDAFDEARRRDVPVLVSIGYSTCHWCHVMARESFSDDVTAREINDGFVAIKVDREEHPEVDAAYLAAAGAFTGSLGWPLTVFTTPDGRPFYAGTYWPPEPRPPLPAFRQVLAAVREAWEERRDQVDETSQQLAEALQRLGAVRPPADRLPGSDELMDAARRLARLEDREYGGFAAASVGMDTPKFPTVPALRFLQATAALGDGGEPEVAHRALAAMATSPLRDPVDGGFFRYATRRDWTVPHYERMLTDNAGLLEVALDDGDAATARGIAAFLREVMQLPSGGFAAAQDSESMVDGRRSEGGYYVRDAAARASLDPPALDGKVITGWNGLAIAALARGGVRLQEPTWIEAARWAADCVLVDNIDANGMLRRASLDEIPSRAAGALEDWGLLASGLLGLAAATGDVLYATKALDLIDACVRDGALRTPGGGDPVLAAQGVPITTDAADGDHPSGPASVAAAALAAWRLGAGERYREIAAGVVASHSSIALDHPVGYGALLETAVGLAAAPRQVVVVAPGSDDPLVAAAGALRADVIAVVTPEQAQEWAEAGFELFEAKALVGGRAALYDCRGFTCRLPVTEASQLAES